MELIHLTITIQLRDRAGQLVQNGAAADERRGQREGRLPQAEAGQ